MPNSLFKTGRTICALFIVCTSLSACAAPPALQVLSLVIDGVSYLATEKTVTDHGLSVVTQQDCKMLRSLQGDDICQKEDEVLEEELIETEELIAQAPQ